MDSGKKPATEGETEIFKLLPFEWGVNYLMGYYDIPYEKVLDIHTIHPYVNLQRKIWQIRADDSAERFMINELALLEGKVRARWAEVCASRSPGSEQLVSLNEFNTSIASIKDYLSTKIDWTDFLAENYAEPHVLATMIEKCTKLGDNLLRLLNSAGIF